MDPNPLLLTAAIACGAITLLHVVVGGREIAAPLLAARDLDRTAKFTNYYCWHLVSATLAAMTGALGYAAFAPAADDLAVFVGLIAAAFALWGLALPPGVGQSYARMPQGWLFAPVAALALIGAA